jgi:4-alpha-glucanotransferase
MTSVANQAILPLQDVLGLGGEARMNFPSKAEGNWEWRYQADSLAKELGDRLQTLTRLSGRAPQPK